MSILLLTGMVIISSFWISRSLRDANANDGDAPNYLSAAYHLNRYGVFSEAPVSENTPPSIGREPAYSFVLSLLMSVNSDFHAFAPECLSQTKACDARILRPAAWLNLFLIEFTGIALFATAWRLFQMPIAALTASAYFLLNPSANKFWFDPMSDRLAVLLVALTMLSVVLTWSGRAVQWALVGLNFGLLTLTKGIFLPLFALGAILILTIAAIRHSQRIFILKRFSVAASIYVCIVGGWTMRNYAVSNQVRFTDARSGIALSTREVFDHMSLTQYLAAFVIWSPGGPGLAEKIFSREVTAPFNLDEPGGFYDRGQNGYGTRVDAYIQSMNINRWEAIGMVDREIIQSIFDRPVAFILATVPVFYRGLRIDSFALLGIPCLYCVLFAALRARNMLLASLLLAGTFNQILYALVSLNIPRYQLTAMPAVAIAAAAACATKIARDRAKT